MTLRGYSQQELEVGVVSSSEGRRRGATNIDRVRVWRRLMTASQLGEGEDGVGVGVGVGGHLHDRNFVDRRVCKCMRTGR